jgi:hypothetical protein
MSISRVAYDPSVADYRATKALLAARPKRQPEDGGGKRGD